MCKTLHAKRCKVTNKLRDVRRTLSHMCGRLYGTTEGRNVVLNPVPSQWEWEIFVYRKIHPHVLRRGEAVVLGSGSFPLVLGFHCIVPIKTKRESLFRGEVLRVFDRGWNNSYFDSTVNNTIMPRNKILRHRLVLTGTICVGFRTGRAAQCHL